MQKSDSFIEQDSETDYYTVKDVYVKLVSEENLIQRGFPVKKQLSKWLMIAKGPLSMKEFGIKTGLNPVFLSRLKTGQIERPLKIEEICSIAFYNQADTVDVIDNQDLARDLFNPMEIILRELIYYNGFVWKTELDHITSSQEGSIDDATNNISNMHEAVLNTMIKSGYEVRKITESSKIASEDTRTRLLQIKEMFHGSLYSVSDISPSYQWYGCYINDISPSNAILLSQYNNFMNKEEILSKYGESIARRAEAFIRSHSDMFLIDFINPKFLDIASYSFLLDDAELYFALSELLDFKFSNSFSLVLVALHNNKGYIQKQHFFNRADGKQTESPIIEGLRMKEDQLW